MVQVSRCWGFGVAIPIAVFAISEMLYTGERCANGLMGSGRSVVGQYIGGSVTKSWFARLSLGPAVS